MALKKKTTLSSTAKKNTSLSVKQGREEVKKIEGTPLDPSIKHLGAGVVGMSIGVTVNMGDFQSLRVDTWLTDVVWDGESQEEAYARISGVLDKTLQETVSYCSEEYKSS